MQPYNGANPRVFIWATQLSAKRFLRVALISAKQRHENMAAERYGIQGW